MTPRRALLGMQMAATVAGAAWLMLIAMLAGPHWRYGWAPLLVVLFATYLQGRCEARIIATWEPWA